MADYLRSCVHTFTIPGDATNIYAMIDAAIVADIKQGKTPQQIATIDSYVFTPTPLQMNGDYSDPNPANHVKPVIPRWAGNQPVAVYFKGTPAQMQSALAKYYR